MTDTPSGRTLPKVETTQDAKQRRRRNAPQPEPEATAPAQRFVVVKGERYPFPTEFTGRELLWIQQETGLRAAEVEEAAGAGDVQALCALTVVAQRRTGVENSSIDELLDLPFGNADDGIDFLEEDGRPPADAGGEGTGT